MSAQTPGANSSQLGQSLYGPRQQSRVCHGVVCSTPGRDRCPGVLLQVVAEQPHITVRVIPYAAGAHPGMPGSLALLSFPDPDDGEIIYIDSMANDSFLEAEADIDRCTTIFDTLGSLALGPDDSLALIATTMHELTRELETA